MLFKLVLLSLGLLLNQVYSLPDASKEVDIVPPPVAQKNEEPTAKSSLVTTVQMESTSSSLLTKANSEIEKKPQIDNSKKSVALNKNATLVEPVVNVAKKKADQKAEPAAKDAKVVPPVVTEAPLAETVAAVETTTLLVADLDAVPEFEDRQEAVEGGKAEEPAAEQSPGEPAAPVVAPAVPEEKTEEGEGVAREDLEPKEGGGSVHDLVEDAKGNVDTAGGKGKELQATAQIDFNQAEDTNFLSFIIVGALLVCCVYVLQHNKKRILGLMFEGRSSSVRGRGGVRYRRLSQRDDSVPDDVIY